MAAFCERAGRGASKFAFIIGESCRLDDSELTTYCVVLYNGDIKYVLSNDRRLKPLIPEWKLYPPKIITTVQSRVNINGKKEYRVKWADTLVQTSWVPHDYYETLLALTVPDVVKASVLSRPSYEVEVVVGMRKCRGKDEYLVRWKGFPGEDSWEPAENFNYCPQVIEAFEGLQVASGQSVFEYPSITHCDTAAPRSMCCNPDAEWDVFTSHFLLHIQHALRYGWRSSRNLAGRVRRGAQTWFPQAAVDRIFVGSRAAMVQKRGSSLQQYSFEHPRDVPTELVGKDQEGADSCWWRVEADNGELISPDLQGTCMERKLLIVKGPVVFHYHTSLYRLSISFDFAVATRSLWSPNWTVVRGGDYAQVDS